MSFKAAIIGAGRWAEVHRQTLLDAGHELIGVLVSSQGSRERVEREWGVAATTDLDQFMAWDSEAVIVVSPNYLHAEHAIAALKANKHVLIEKPMATNLSDCDRILAAARQAGKVVAVGLEMRVFELFRRVKEIIDSGQLGLPLHLKLDLWRRPYRSGAGGWKSDPQKLGSAILEEPIHYLDLARWYFSALGEPLVVQAWANSRPGREYLNENLDVRLELPGGAQALVTRSIAAYKHAVNIKLVGDKGALEARWEGEMDLDLEPKVSLTVHTEQGTSAVAVTQNSGHVYDLPKQTQAFFQAIATGTPPVVTGEDGRAAVALCLAVEESLKQHAPVGLDENLA